MIVAEIGAGNVGAAAEAERVISHYLPDVALFVGIAGGIKDLKHGDVVAATKVYGYESSKDGDEGFTSRPAVQLTAYALEQRARYEAGEEDWRQRIRRVTPASGKPLPDAKVAPIAAGEKVVASNLSSTYTFIRSHYSDAVAVEMEGLGFLLGVHMNQPTQGIVIRGISDLVGDKGDLNDQTWQPIAARHAAAFAFQVLAKFEVPNEVTRRDPPKHRLNQPWQEKHLHDATATAGPRYSSELRVGTPLHDVFEALGSTAQWFSVVRNRGRKLSKLVNRFVKCVETTSGGGWGGPAFPPELRPAGQALVEPLTDIVRKFSGLADRAPGQTPGSIAAATTSILPQVRELNAALFSDFEKEHGEGTADSASFRQYQAEYQLAFPAANLDATRELVAALEDVERWGDSGAGRANASHGVLLVGNAGVGKTHGICDIAHDRFRRGLYTVVLFGEQFTTADEPWERVRQLLGFEPMGRDQLIEILNDAGSSSGSPLLFCIDGLNESRPRSYWRSWLASFAAQIGRYSNIRLCVSCRSTYEAIAVPDGHGLERIEHFGFAGVEFSACRHFFSHYGLEPPVAPSFHPEFANPLFLRLACETLKASGVRRMPAGWHGLNTALHAFVREKNKVFAGDFERDARERVPQRALQQFIIEAERTSRVYLPWSDAASAVGRGQPAGLAGPTILEWLVRAGLLITDRNPEESHPDSEEVVRIAFERLGDHLFAERLLNGIKVGEIAIAIKTGALSFAFASADTVRNNNGLVEALSIQLPEHPRFSSELIDVLPEGSPREAVLRATISALPWRDPERITTRTQQIVIEGLSTRGYGQEVFDRLLAVAVQISELDALWVHGQLARQTMRSRDGFLCGYLHERVGGSNPVERLLRAPFEVESVEIPEAVCLRWSTLLLWFCVAADRRVRDRATKALVALTQSHPKLWSTLIDEFCSVNDDYVVERCFCAAYGALLRSRDPEAEREVAAAVERAKSTYPALDENALIRDHARCILELALLDGVLPEGIDINRARRLRNTEWPLIIPSEADVERYKERWKEYPKLYTSCLTDDFFTYTLSAMGPYEHVVSKNEMGRWILNHVVSDMAYGGEAIASYDRYMLYTHGGGRGRPRWAERVGKKYQWIALSRLAARLSDNVKPKINKWEPKVRGIPLVYERGRDTDPSLLLQEEPPNRETAVWWLPVAYDFASVADKSNYEWTTVSADIPSSERLLQPIPRGDSREWQLLEGYPTWSADTGRDDEGAFAPHRQVWTQIRGYLVKRKSADRVFKWMSRQHFMGRWMHEGSEYHQGYLGEYPWGILFTMYPEQWHSRGGPEKKIPARLVPICNSVSASYEEDAYQVGSITVHVPARTFFEDDTLRWDGLSGFRDRQGHTRFLDPSIAEAGSSALLVDRSYLLDFLARQDLAVVWSVLGEKIFISGGPDSPRLEFSRAHLLDQSGILRSSNLIVAAQEP